MTATDGIVVFDYAEWIVQYPEFSAIAQPQAQSFFNRVTIGGTVDNTPSSPLPYDPANGQYERVILLNMAVSHMAFLFGPGADGKPREIVGRISSATEGSVSVAAEYAIPKGDLQAWWNQSPYGALFYASTLKYRTGFYVPPPFCSPGVGLNRGFGLFGLPGFGRRWF